MKKFGWTAVLFICLSLFSMSYAADIRVHLMTASSVNISSVKGEVRGMTGSGECFTFSGEKKFYSKENVIMSEKIKPSDSIELFSSDKAPVMVNKKAYPGTLLLINRKKGTFMVINRVDIEEYLFGVLGGEMPSSWPLEALKAQAVAARTYAAGKIRAPRNPDFDLFSTTQDQVYIGKSDEIASIVKAVKETSGQILAYDNEPAEAFFHSSCGGNTAASEEVFACARPYLRGGKCGYCNLVSNSAWTYEISRNQLSDILLSKGVIKSVLYDMEIKKIDASERAAQVKLITADGEVVVKGSDLRLAIGPGLQRSTRYTLERKNIRKTNIIKIETFIASYDSPLTVVNYEIESDKEAKSVYDFITKNSLLKNNIFPEITVKADLKNHKVASSFSFSGNGWGHGVGLCQWGALGMSKEGRTYTDILNHYYPCAEIVNLSSLPVKTKINTNEKKK